MRALILTTAFGVVLAGGLTAAPVPKVKEKTTEEKLAGKWKLVKSDQPLSTEYDFIIEYKPKGVMTFTRVPKEGKPHVSEGKYKVGDGTIEWTINENGNERGETSKIKTLTDEKLIIEDPDGIKEEFEKIVEKKKDEKKDEKKDPEKKKD
jgi:uncharacterized protein (TIGR03066 family)